MAEDTAELRKASVKYEVVPFKKGMAAEMRFVIPDAGDANANLAGEDNSYYIIHAKFHFDEKKIVLNAKKDGVWVPGSKVEGHYEGKERGDEMTFKFEAQADDWVAYVDGKEVCRYKHVYNTKDVQTILFWPADKFKGYTIYLI